MPRVYKYLQPGSLDNIPDNALAVIEHTALFYIIDRRFSGMNKWITFAGAGFLYETYIDMIKRQDPTSKSNPK